MSLVVLCGPGYSGKSTLASSLARFGWTVVSLDAILRAEGHEPATGLPPERWKAAFDAATVQVTSLLQNGQTAVVDDTACFKFLRLHWRGVAGRCGVPMKLVVLRADEALVRARREANLHAPSRPHVVDHVMEEHLRGFEWPDEAEGGLDLIPGSPTETLAEEVLRFVRSTTSNPRSA